MPAGERRGVGLHNTRERLTVLYGGNCRFAVMNAQPGLRVEMALPLEVAAANADTPAARNTRVSGAASA
jgi:signal transduction histidine kinase